MARGPRIGEVLIEAGLIDEFQLESALGQQKRWGGRLGRALVSAGFLDEPTLVRVLSQVLRIPVAELADKRPAPEVLDLLSADLAEKYTCLPLFTKREGGKTVLFLGLEDPLDLAALDELAFRLGMPVRPVLVGPTELKDAIARFYRPARHDRASDPNELAGGFSETLLEPGDTAPVLSPLLDESDAHEPGSLAFAPAPAPAPVKTDEPPPPAPIAAVAPPRVPVRSVAAPEVTTGVMGLPPVDASPPPPPAKPRDVPTRTILRALTRLLVEKGVIDRDELMARVRSLDSSKDPVDPQG